MGAFPGSEGSAPANSQTMTYIARLAVETICSCDAGIVMQGSVDAHFCRPYVASMLFSRPLQRRGHRAFVGVRFEHGLMSDREYSIFPNLTGCRELTACNA